MSNQTVRRAKAKKSNKNIITKQNVGIDISKKDFAPDSYRDCFSQLLEDGTIRIVGSHKFKNTLNGITQFMDWVEKKCIDDLEVHFTMEATGVYYENLAYFLDDNDQYVSVLLPNKTKAFMQSYNIKTKNDNVDAKLLGRMGLERKLKKWQPLSSNMRMLKKLCRERVMLQNEKTAVCNRLHAEKSSHQPHTDIIERYEDRIKFIKQQISTVEKQINNIIKTDEVLTKKVDLICKVKGIGITTAATIIAETDGFVLIKNRSQLISYAGYDVIENQSGSSINGKTKISKKGNKYIRRTLHFPALNAVRREPMFQELYQRVFDRTKINPDSYREKGYVAVQRKLLVLIYAIFKDDLEFDPEFYLK